MFLIMSAANVGQDLQAEFGAIPPAFLPLGNRRLFQHQLQLVPKNKKVFLSIPQSYQVQDMDKEWLTSRGVTLLALPENLSIGESLMAAITLIEHPLDSDLSVLYGDTLLTPPTGTDIITISHVDNSYGWATINDGKSTWLNACDTNIDSQSQVVSGYFNFASPRTLLRCLTQTQWQFLEALDLYHQQGNMQVCESSDWLDFGHINTYYRSKASYTTQRAFNKLTINEDWIEKSSSNNKKIMAESAWFQQIPNSLKHYTPQFLGEFSNDDSYSYRLEYLYQTALNELFVFGNLPEIVWKQIFNQMCAFLSTCSRVEPSINDVVDSVESLFAVKTKERLQDFCSVRGYDWEESWFYNNELTLSLKELYQSSLENLPPKSLPSVVHGDFCFSNTLYDFRKNRIKVIDPRGITSDNQQSIYGYIHYDIAKICHSVLGLYDWILAGYYQVTLEEYQLDFSLADTAHLAPIQVMFTEKLCDKFQLTSTSLYAMQIQLFLSMLPLHSDDTDRQNALLANAFRLYKKMLGV